MQCAKANTFDVFFFCFFFHFSYRSLYKSNGLRFFLSSLLMRLPFHSKTSLSAFWLLSFALCVCIFYVRHFCFLVCCDAQRQSSPGKTCCTLISQTEGLHSNQAYGTKNKYWRSDVREQTHFFSLFVVATHLDAKCDVWNERNSVREWAIGLVAGTKLKHTSHTAPFARKRAKVVCGKTITKKSRRREERKKKLQAVQSIDEK